MELRELLDTRYSNFQPDTYQSKLPEWMRRNAAAGYRGKISESDARYLERVAWETTRSMLKSLHRPQNQE